jgi:hypothetical protein
LSRHLDSRHTFTFSPHHLRKFFVKIPALENREGAGNAGASGAPAALRAKIESTQASHHRFADHVGIPCAMVLTASFVISSVSRAFLPPSPA